MTLGMGGGREGAATHTRNLLSGSLGSFERFFRNACGSLTATLAGPMVLLPTFFFWVSSFTEELNLDTCLGREGGVWGERVHGRSKGERRGTAPRGTPCCSLHSHFSNNLPNCYTRGLYGQCTQSVKVSLHSFKVNKKRPYTRRSRQQGQKRRIHTQSTRYMCTLAAARAAGAAGG